MKKLLLIDANALIHRAFHALPRLTDPQGRLVNAVYGFSSVLLKVLHELEPKYIVCVFDYPAPTFRHKEFKKYKAQRPKTPHDLVLQIPIVKKVIRAFNMPIFEKRGYEADDIIGTIVDKVSKGLSQEQNFSSAELASRPFTGRDRARPLQPQQPQRPRPGSNSPRAKNLFLSSPSIETIIITGDLDALQLVNENTKVYTLRRGMKDEIIYGPKKVKEKYGLDPRQLMDFKGLVGDPSDNIPGVPGVGPKTASQLLKKYGSIEEMYRKIKNKKSKIFKKLEDYKKQAMFSKMLATIKKDVPIKFKLKDCQIKDYKTKKVIDLFQKLGFKSLLQRLNYGTMKMF